MRKSEWSPLTSAPFIWETVVLQSFQLHPISWNKSKAFSVWHFVPQPICDNQCSVSFPISVIINSHPPHPLLQPDKNSHLLELVCTCLHYLLNYSINHTIHREIFMHSLEHIVQIHLVHRHNVLMAKKKKTQNEFESKWTTSKEKN